MLGNYNKELTEQIENMTYEEQVKLKKYLEDKNYYNDYTYEDEDTQLTSQAIEIIADAIIDVVYTICNLIKNRRNK